MPQMKDVVLLLNIGWQDADAFGLSDYSAEALSEGNVIEVNDVIAGKMMARGVAAIYDPSAPAPRAIDAATLADTVSEGRFGTRSAKQAAEELKAPVEGTSSVAEQSDKEAINIISRMRSVDKLTAIVEFDAREEVTAAARTRLVEVTAQG